MSTNNFSEPESSYPPAEIPHPVRPMVRNGGWVLPYRGMEAHGVDPNSSPPDPVPDIFDEGQVEPFVQSPPNRATVPVPVRIVAEGSRETKEFRTSQESAGADVRQIVGRNDARTKLTLFNTGTVTVWIGPDSRVRKTSGYPLAANTSISLESYGAVYALSDDGTEQNIAILIEYVLTKP